MPNIVITIIISIGTDRPLQTVYTQISLIRVYTVCHSYSNISDTSRGSRMDYFKFYGVLVDKLFQYLGYTNNPTGEEKPEQTV